MFQRQDTWTNQISHLARLGAPEAAPPTGTGGRGTAPLTRSTQPSNSVWVENTGVTNP